MQTARRQACPREQRFRDESQEWASPVHPCNRFCCSYVCGGNQAKGQYAANRELNCWSLTGPPQDALSFFHTLADQSHRMRKPLWITREPVEQICRCHDLSAAPYRTPSIRDRTRFSLAEPMSL